MPDLPHETTSVNLEHEIAEALAEANGNLWDLTEEPEDVYHRDARAVLERVRLFEELNKLRDALSSIRQDHRPSDMDDRLCAEGCNGRWPCVTRLEADHALGYDR